MAAVAAQLNDFTHTCFNVAPYEEYIQVAERLNKAAPGNFAKKTMFLTTGAEAVENAVKIARVATGRTGIVAFNGAFHGRTMMGMALTGKVVPYKKGFGPFPAEVYHAPFPKPYLRDRRRRMRWRASMTLFTVGRRSGAGRRRSSSSRCRARAGSMSPPTNSCAN